MKNSKKLFALGAMVLLIGATSVTAFAASSYSTPAEALAGLTGKTVAEIAAERTETGKTYGTLASEAGKLDEFQKETIEIKKERLSEKVAAGILTQAEADQMISNMETNQANCDGLGSGQAGQNKGMGFGGANGNRQGRCGGCAVAE